MEKFPPNSPINGWILFHELTEFTKKNGNKKEIYDYTNCNDIDEVNEEALSKLFKSIEISLNTKKIPVHVLKDDELLSAIPGKSEDRAVIVTGPSKDTSRPYSALRNFNSAKDKLTHANMSQIVLKIA